MLNLIGKMPKLLLIENGKAQEVQMGQELTVGRAYSNLLRLDGEEISRVHAIIYRRGNDHILRDLDSKNGVMLNGQKVANALLGRGDEVQIGPHTLVFDPPPHFDLAAFLGKHGGESAGEFHSTRSNELESSIVFARSAETPASGNGVAKAAAPATETDVFFSADRLQEMLNESTRDDALGQKAIRLMQGLHVAIAGDPGDISPTQALLQVVVEVLGADRGVVAFRGAGDGSLTLGGIVPLEKDVAVNRVVMRAVLKEGQAVLCNSAQNDPRFSTTETVRKDSIGSMLACPIHRGDDMIGLIYIDAIDRTDVFTLHKLLILNCAANLVTLTGIPSKVAGGEF